VLSETACREDLATVERSTRERRGDRRPRLGQLAPPLRPRREPVNVKYALPARSTANRASRTVTSATLHAASAAAIAAHTVRVSMIATASAP